MATHAKKISVDLRGFHIFDDGDSDSDSEVNTVAQAKTLKSKIKHAKKMSVDLAGYHIFGTNESESEDEEDDAQAGNEGTQDSSKMKMHSKKISVDLRGFDLFYDSDDEEESEDEDDEAMFVGAPPEDGAAGVVSTEKKQEIGTQAVSTFKKAQKMYLGNQEEDEDLQGFHLFDEYDSENEESDDGVIRLDEMEKDQLVVLVRGILVENAILKDAAARARAKIDARKKKITEVEETKRTLLKNVAMEMNNMRDIINSLAGAVSGRQSTGTAGASTSRTVG